MAGKKPSAGKRTANEAKGGDGRARRRSNRRIVAKFGTNLLTGGTEQLSRRVMSDLVGQVVRLRRDGIEVIVVTSGAIAAGRSRVDLAERRREIPVRQVLASVGQSHLMQSYDRLFTRHEVVIAQTLLTRRECEPGSYRPSTP